MSRNQQIQDLENLSSVYHTEDLAGANEAYHLALRDQLIPPGGGTSALEIGCGKGLWTQILCKKYDEVDALDGSQALLDYVIEQNKNAKATLRTHLSLVEDFAAEQEKTWQHIYLTFLLEHLKDPPFVLKKIKSLLRSDGKLFIAVPNADSLHRQLAFRMGLIQSLDELSENDHKVGHRHVYTESLLQEHITQAGFKIQDMRGIGFKPLNLARMKDWPPELIDTCCHAADLAPEYAAYLSAIVTHP